MLTVRPLIASPKEGRKMPNSRAAQQNLAKHRTPPRDLGFEGLGFHALTRQAWMVRTTAGGAAKLTKCFRKSHPEGISMESGNMK